MSDESSVRARLAPFLEANPKSLLKEEAGSFYIVKPWGDRSLRFRVAPDDTELVESLNQLVLPTRLTAIWHRDSNDLEVIWGAVPDSVPEYGRSFAFRFGTNFYRCEFCAGSERLKKIANATVALEAVSETGFRNVYDIRGVLKRLGKASDPIADWRLTSFWIRSIDAMNVDLVKLARNLNFYMRYFDRDTPCMFVHDDPSNPQLEVPVRFPNGGFPGEISARPLNDYLLTLWEGTVRASDPFRRYIYNYQILEYAAFYYLQANRSRQLKKVIFAPDATVNADVTVSRTLEILADSKMNDEQQFNTLLQEIVDPKSIWSLMEPNLSAFCRDLEFDGGFCLAPMLKDGAKLDDFLTIWANDKFSVSLRKLRNALVHGRESRSSTSIAPSGRNHDLLRPWIPLISAAAMEVILYNEVL